MLVPPADNNNFTHEISLVERPEDEIDEEEEEILNETVPQPLHIEEEIKPAVTPAVKIKEVSPLELEIKTTPEIHAANEPVIEPAKKVTSVPYDPILDLRDYKYPVLDLLETHGSDKIVQDTNELENNKNQIITTLKNYDIQIQKISATVGPTVTLYEIIPAAGVRISRIKTWKMISH